MKTGVPVSPSVCKFTKDVGRSGREENPGNDLQTISYIFRKLDPGYAVAAVYRHSGPDVQNVLTRYQRRMKVRCRPGSSGPGKHSEREKAGAGTVEESRYQPGSGGPGKYGNEGEGRCRQRKGGH